MGGGVEPPISHQGVAAGPTIEDNPFAQANNDPFVNVFALEPNSDESSSGDVSSAKSIQVIQPHNHLEKWSKDHPLDNVIDKMAEENVPAPAPTRSDEQILPFNAWLPVVYTYCYLLCKAIEITPKDSAHPFLSPPAGEQVMDFVNELGYPKEIYFVSRMLVNNLYQSWRAILSLTT
ncbi:hypothetical protein Tco_1575109, partial [Tanacetum coccineum]